jgi:hypothetical protein
MLPKFRSEFFGERCPGRQHGFLFFEVYEYGGIYTIHVLQKGKYIGHIAPCFSHQEAREAIQAHIEYMEREKEARHKFTNKRHLPLDVPPRV